MLLLPNQELGWEIVYAMGNRRCTLISKGKAHTETCYLRFNCF